MDDLIEISLDYLNAQQERLKREFDLSSWERYDYNQESGLLTFSSQGKTGVVADFHVVGTTSKSSGTWLWSWENPSIYENVKHCMNRVREYGETHGFEKLTRAQWPGDERDGWEMAAVAAYLLEAEGAYRAPDDTGAMFMILKNVRRQIWA